MDSDLMRLRIVRRPEVEKVTGLSRATLYRLLADGQFPAPVRLTTGNAVGWREAEIREWLESREAVGSHGAVVESGETGDAAGPAPSPGEGTP